MGQPGMRVTVDAAMRARDVSRSWTDDDPPAPAAVPAEPATTHTSKAERRRLGKRHARARH